jgi:predicted Zn finger-like uncharacterized protein
MSIRFSCPECQKEFTVPDDLAGKKIRCKACNTMMLVPGGEEVVAEEPRPARHRRDEEVDDRPRRRDRDEPPRDDDRPRRRERKKKGSALKVVLVVGLLGVFLVCPMCGGGGWAIWHFGIRDRGAADDMKYVPDNFTELHAVNYDLVKASPAFTQIQNCPNSKDHFSFLRTPGGKTLDVTRALVAGREGEKTTILTLRNAPTIQDLVDANVKTTETKIEGKTVYDTEKVSYLIDGKRVVIAPNGVIKEVLKRNGQPRLRSTIRDAMPAVDFSRPEVTVTDLSQLSGFREIAQIVGDEFPVAIVNDVDYQAPMVIHLKFVCADEKAAETFASRAGRGGMPWQGKLQVVEVRHRGNLVTFDARAANPCDAFGATMGPNPIR